jgi:hypothetical protein
MKMSTFVLVALLFTVHAGEPSQSNPCATIDEAAPIAEVGAFSNMRFTEEHAYGETVLLWRTANCVFGLFEWAQGLQGDTPIGELQHVTHQPDTGTLRFSAKLTAGAIAGPTSATPQPSRDLFTFDGTLSVGRLAGGLTHATQIDPSPPVRSVMLTASARDAEFMHGSATYGAWRATWEPILRVRGPKW